MLTGHKPDMILARLRGRMVERRATAFWLRFGQCVEECTMGTEKNDASVAKPRGGRGIPSGKRLTAPHRAGVTARRRRSLVEAEDRSRDLVAAAHDHRGKRGALRPASRSFAQTLRGWG